MKRRIVKNIRVEILNVLFKNIDVLNVFFVDFNVLNMIDFKKSTRLIEMSMKKHIEPKTNQKKLHSTNYDCFPHNRS